MLYCTLGPGGGHSGWGLRSGAERENHLPRPAGSTSFDAVYLNAVTWAGSVIAECCHQWIIIQCPSLQLQVAGSQLVRK